MRSMSSAGLLSQIVETYKERRGMIKALVDRVKGPLNYTKLFQAARTSLARDFYESKVSTIYISSHILSQRVV